MIPSLHLADLISSLFCVFAARRIYFSHRRKPSANMADFLKVYVSLAVFFLLSSLPMFTSSPVLVQVFYILSHPLLILSPFFLLRLSLRLMERKIGLGLHIFIYAIVIAGLIIDFIFFRESVIQSAGILYYWKDTMPDFMSYFSGIFVGVLTICSGILFFLGGKRTESKPVKIRSFRIAAAIFLLLFANISNYVFPFLVKGWILKWSLTLLSSFVCLFALFIMLTAIYYKREEE